MANGSGNVCRVPANLLVTDGDGQRGPILPATSGNPRRRFHHRRRLQNAWILALLQRGPSKDAGKTDGGISWLAGSERVFADEA